MTAPVSETVSAPPVVTWTDRKSTRLNSSHSQISYAVFCLKKKKDKVVQTVSDRLKSYLLIDRGSDAKMCFTSHYRIRLSMHRHLDVLHVRVWPSAVLSTFG